jgi:hypothetical protein
MLHCKFFIHSDVNNLLEGLGKRPEVLMGSRDNSRPNRQNRDRNHSFFFPSQDSASINMTVGRGVSALNRTKWSTKNSQGAGRSCHHRRSVRHDPRPGFAAPVPTDAERSACTSDAFRCPGSMLPFRRQVRPGSTLPAAAS